MKNLFLFFMLLFTCAVHAQDPHFSQPSSVPLTINPGFAGSLACGRAEVGYRLQWPKLSSSSQTFNASYDQYFKVGGVGFNYMHDGQGKGTIINDHMEIDYAPYIALFKDSSGRGRVIIQPGISVGYFHKTADFSKLNFGDMIDPRRGFVSPSNESPGKKTSNNIDLSAGIVAYTKHIAVGFAAFHLNEPNEGFIGESKLPVRFVTYLSGEINCAALMLTPSVLITHQQDFHELFLNVNARVERFSLGVGLRNHDAMVFSAGYNYSSFSLRYAYDLTISGLAGTTGGAHEVHVGYQFATKKWEDARTNLRNFN
jgi:type IX secretion system PorP/SprF family membrane protein